ncbi:ATP-grasp domain-containing protein [Dyadobacter luticola]|uniref:ATP-grasp domain-containing protein n=1 Tax=Dyadobacter luticola TaxID=1979387 RepID=A0A5R9KYE3_9BACT|nr:hypothetical protein [Dyadobacter luticola]TLV01332.1 hypothetical protein FEN17_18015 [Dyadobacter luticola]
MRSFYCIYNSSGDSRNIAARVQALRKACTEEEIHFIALDQHSIDFSRLPEPEKGDGIYNCSRDGMLLERVFIQRKLRTFYNSFPEAGVIEISNYWSILHDKSDIPTPKTVWIGTNDRTILSNYVDYLKGFPIIIKCYGGTGGIGVIKVDSFSSLYSLADYLTAIQTRFALREFIPSTSCERLVVLGNEVIAAVSRPIVKNDFRSSSFDIAVNKLDTDEILESIAVRSVNQVNLSLGGVDIITDSRDGQSYLLEVNFPFNFIPTQETTGVNIPGKMIKWLFSKQI